MKSDANDPDPKVMFASPLRESLRTWLKREAAGRRLRMQDLLELMVRRERGDLGRGRLTGRLDCPACGVDAYYCREADRFVHADGSENRECWLAVITGRVSGDERTPTELERAMRQVGA